MFVYSCDPRKDISMMQEASKEEKQKAMVTADKLLKDGGYSKSTKVKIMAKKYICYLLSSSFLFLIVLGRCKAVSETTNR